MENRITAGTPVHLWIVGLASLIWNLAAAHEYLMINIRDPDYLEQIGGGAGMMQTIDAFPHSVMAAWAIGVWGAVAGSLLLLLRSRHSVLAFALSLLGTAVNTLYLAAVGLPEDMATLGAMLMSLTVWVVAVLLLLYSVRMRRRGTLR
jgi:uncharacterized membrane protein